MTLELIAYELLSRDDIADLRATHDAIELADFLINFTRPDLIKDATEDLDEDDFLIFVNDLRLITEEMILADNDS